MKEVSEMIDVPVIPLRDIVVYPNMAVPLFIGRKCSIAAVESASEKDQRVLLVTQKNEQTQNPKITDLYKVGVYAKILQVMKLPDNTIKILVEGISRADVYHLQRKKDLITATPIFSEMVDVQDQKQGLALTKAIKDNFKKLLDVNAQVPKDVSATILAEKRLDRLVDTVASLVNAPIARKQYVLELVDLKERALFLLQLLVEELEIYELEQKIKDTVKNQIEKNQREYYLNEQVKAIYKELGDVDEATENEKLRTQISQAKMSKEATQKASAELRKLKMMPSSSAEASVCRNYIETLIKLPWNKKDKVNKDIVKAEGILDEDHYGLEKVKERIIEHLAVLSRQKKSKGTILCLVGPPGVGKTSLGRSIAEATGRSYVRMALGGVKDESEIRGHRRTYIGSMPGQIINKLSKVGVNNPLFLLDEIDKISSDYRGDPAAALLEVLDPEQNNTFSDHYLEVDFDLSDVMFVATANSLNIPIALRDRMEIIHLSGYTEDEKYHIAKRYLVPKAMAENGLQEGELSINDNAIRDVIRYYTREAGVRRLQQEINRICRKTVKALLTYKRKKHIKVDDKNLNEYLGVRKYDIGLKQAEPKVGQVTGLAWTEVGGDLLTIETAVMAGKGKLKYTGTLGDVMKESIEAAMTVVRMRAPEFGLAVDFYDKHDIHIHVPEGATPKDGPSAGIAMCTAMISSLTGLKVNNLVAMTGEITLRGDVLAIGGLKEKLLAAVRGGIKVALIPWDNKKDLEELPKTILASINVVPVKTIDEVFDHALVKKKS